MDVSVISTVLNEEHSIAALIESLQHQTMKPKEVVVVDGGSSDATVLILKGFAKLPFKLVVIEKKGNRSVGRNEAIKRASTELIAITDAGCVPEKEWLKELVAAYDDKGVEVVVAGGAAPISIGAAPLSPLQSAMVPYVLVMPDKINPDTFLPATRSMLISKTLWQQIGGFDESLSDNEDYAFAKKLEKLKHQKKCSIMYAPKAIVGWQPRQTLSQFAQMVFRFARGDAQARIFRPKVVAIFGRYILSALLLAYGTLFGNGAILSALLLFGVLYVFWAVLKNAKYVTRPAILWLPVLQLVSDVMVMKGTLIGLLLPKTSPH